MDLNHKIIDVLDAISYSRPIPNREFDQIYMKASSMLEQVKYIDKFIMNKKIIFLGDGDGMSILLGVLGHQEIINATSSISVYDFDERILFNIKKQLNEFCVTDIPFSYKLYNVIMPIQLEDTNKYDFFYINPPYGSKNMGISCKIWIDRCIDLCGEHCMGCVIIPYDSRSPWSITNMKNIQLYLLEKGFVIRDMLSYMHQYYLDDNPELKSATLIVEKVGGGNADFSNIFLGVPQVKYLYGSPRKIPKYIYSSNTNLLGDRDYNWEFGKDMFWENRGL